jgi:hypothetical protein
MDENIDSFKKYTERKKSENKDRANSKKARE